MKTIPVNQLLSYLNYEFPATQGHIPLKTSLETIEGKLKAFEDLAKAVKTECNQFNFPDEDRPKLYAALQEAEKFLT